MTNINSIETYLKGVKVPFRSISPSLDEIVEGLNSAAVAFTNLENGKQIAVLETATLNKLCEKLFSSRELFLALIQDYAEAKVICSAAITLLVLGTALTVFGVYKSTLLHATENSESTLLNKTVSYGAVGLGIGVLFSAVIGIQEASKNAGLIATSLQRFTNTL